MDDCNLLKSPIAYLIEAIYALLSALGRPLLSALGRPSPLPIMPQRVRCGTFFLVYCAVARAPLSPELQYDRLK